KLRDRPLRLITCGSRLVMSSPLSSMRPEVSGKRPLMRLNSVDFPAPFGPMMAWRSPRAMLRLTPLMIEVRPKLLCTSVRLSAAAFISHRSPGLKLRREIFPGAPHEARRPDEGRQARDEQQRRSDPRPDPVRIQCDAEQREDFG